MESNTSFEDLLNDPNVKKIFSPVYNFMFDTKTGRTWRWGRTIEDDPFVGPFPELADVAISNLCDRECEFCYRDSRPDGPIMSVEDFEHVMKELPMTYQIACLHSDEMVYKYNQDNHSLNLVKISDIREGDFIMGNRKLVRVNKVLEKTNNEKMYEIKIIGGRTLRLTSSHLVPTERGNLMVNDLEVGDKLFYNMDIDTDEIDYIDIEKTLVRIGKKYRIDENNMIVIERHKYRYPRKIQISDAFARLCGYYTSEGHLRGFAFHKDEVEVHKEVISDFRDVFGLELRSRKNGKNGITLETGYRFLMELVFVHAVGLGKGAKNKGIGNVWKFSKDKIEQYLKGCLTGDGCVRMRESGISIEYKTASKNLLEGLRFLLEARLGVICSTYSGTPPERYIDDRLLESSTYYSMSVYGKNNMIPLLNSITLVNNYENFMNTYNEIGTKLYSNNKFLSSDVYITSIEEIESSEYVYDIAVDDDRLFSINGNILVHNCGGGEPTMHPDFIEILKIANEYGKVVNYTTNGKHLTDEIIEATKKYCGAVAVSFREDDDLWLKTVKRFIKAGMKTNIHLVVSEKTYKYGIEIMKDLASGNKKYGLDGLFAVIFLLYKPIGRANPDDVLTDESARHFLKEVFKYGDLIGFDSCFAGHIKKAYDAGDITLDWRMIDSCESSRFSVFIDEGLNVKPCSFSSGDEYKWNLRDKSFKDIWRSKEFGKFREKLRENCYDCPLLR